MRLSRFLALCMTVSAVAACGDDEITDPAAPPLAQVRFINGVNDTSALDIRPITQIEWTPFANNLGFRAGTVHHPSDASKPLRFRVFTTSTNAAVTSVVMLDTTLTFTTGERVSVMLTGSARANTLRFVTFNDDRTAPPDNQVGARCVNASSAPINCYFTNTTAETLPSSPSASNVAPLSASPYVARTLTSALPTTTTAGNNGTTAIRVTPVGSTTASASSAGPVISTTSLVAGGLPQAALNVAGSRFSAYFFPAGVHSTHTSTTGVTAGLNVPGVAWFIDRNPADL